MPEKKEIIAICGPTAAGKTKLAIRLALQYNTSILSADSRQCFKELNIGVAKPSTEQLKRVTHYFINYCSVQEEVNASSFEKYALEIDEKVFSKNDHLILAGGTGLYIRAFLDGLDEIPLPDPKIEEEIIDKFKSRGEEWLLKEVMKHDPVFVQKGEIKNPQRTLRALTVKLSTGKSILSFHTGIRKTRNFSIRKIFLDIPKEILYDRINTRVDTMMDQGLLKEAEQLLPLRHLNALQTVGYRELFSYFDGKISLNDAVGLIKKNTRHYAKRQLTWFRKYFIDDTTDIIKE